jgi:transcriptional regulator with XRE-family HTH domain
MELNEKLSKCLEERGIKQTHIAMCLGLKDDTVSRMMAGRRKITASEFMTLCSILNVDPRTFFPELYKKGEAS